MNTAGDHVLSGDHDNLLGDQDNWVLDILPDSATESVTSIGTRRLSRRGWFCRLLFAASLLAVIWGLYQVATLWRYELHESTLSEDGSTLLVVSRIDEWSLGRRFRLDVIDTDTGTRRRVAYQRDLGWPPMEFAISRSGQYVAITTESRLRVIDTHASWFSERRFQLPLSQYYGYVAFTPDEQSVYFHYHESEERPSEGIGVFNVDTEQFHTIWFPNRVRAVRREYAQPPYFGAVVGSNRQSENNRTIEYFYLADGALHKVDEIEVGAKPPLDSTWFTRADPGRASYHVDHETLAVSLSGSSKQLIGSPYRHRPTIAAIVVGFSVLWWLIWCYLTRRSGSKRWPVVNIAVLFALILSTCLARVVTDPDLSSGFRSVQICVLVGTCIGALALIVLSAVHGRRKFSARVNSVLITTSIVLCVLLFLERRFNVWTVGWAMLAGVSSLTVWSIAMARYWLRRLSQGGAESESEIRRVQRFQISDLLVWTLTSAFALMLLSLLGIREINAEYIRFLGLTGSAMGVTAWTAAYMTLENSRALLRWPLGIFAVATAYCALTSISAGAVFRDEIWLSALVGSCAGVVFLSGLAFRFNGYRMDGFRRHQGDPGSAVEPT